MKPPPLLRRTGTNLSAALSVYLTRRVLIVMFLGLSSGLPLALSTSTLAIWMREVGVDLGTIGLFTLVGTPYTIKFLWAPVIDALDVPILTRLLGRRRGWLFFSQILLMAAILSLALCGGEGGSLTLVAAAALMVATASATQDILIDAFRVESLAGAEQAAGMASFVAAYRVGMLVSTAGALYLVSAWESLGFGSDAAWTFAYAVMAALVAIGMATTLLATEPEGPADIPADAAGRDRKSRPWRVAAVAYGAFSDFFSRDLAVAALFFVVLYKLCDAFAGAMTAPFVIDLGFDRTDYANIVKGLGLAATLAGGFLGGFIARAYPLATALWIGALLQMASNLAFAWQAYMGPNLWALSATVAVENLTGGLGTVVFVAYLSTLCRSPLHTATQFALLTALAAVGRTYLSAGSGFLAEQAGWQAFFIISALSALPGLALLGWLQIHGHFQSVSRDAPAGRQLRVQGA